MKLRLIPHNWPTRGLLQAGDRSFPCAIGRSGLRRQKREEDGATPEGVFELRRVLYRADRLPPPRTGLKIRPIGPRDGWCDAPGHAFYNQQVRLPISASAERLARADPLYDLVVVLGYNDAPVVDGLGSAIFLHVAKANFAPTAGCVALRRKDLLWVLSMCGPGSHLRIG